MIRSGASAKARRARSGQPGRLGIVRLYGAALTALRRERWELDKGICEDCGASTFWEPRFAGDPLAYDMAHRRNKRMYGDTLENTKTLCHRSHMEEHQHGLKTVLPR